MEGFTPSAIALGSILLASVVLTASRSAPRDDQLHAVHRLVWAACATQFLHFVEEAFYDLHTRLPEAFGYPGMSFSFFVSINVGALLVWLIGTTRRTSNPITITTFWFLGLASVFNLFAHPILAVVTRGYFPGLLTAPLVGITGILLTRSLLRFTRASADSGRAA